MSEGLAQGPYVAARVGFKPAILLTIGTKLTTEPPRPTNSASSLKLFPLCATVSLAWLRLTGILMHYSLLFTRNDLLVIFHSCTVLRLFHACGLLRTNPGASVMLAPRLGTMFDSLCAWNYYPFHFCSCGNAVRLSCFWPNHALTPVESAANLNDATQLFDYITLLRASNAFASSALIVPEYIFLLWSQFYLLLT